MSAVCEKAEEVGTQHIDGGVFYGGVDHLMPYNWRDGRQGGWGDKDCGCGVRKSREFLSQDFHIFL